MSRGRKSLAFTFPGWTRRLVAAVLTVSLTVGLLGGMATPASANWGTDASDTTDWCGGDWGSTLTQPGTRPIVIERPYGVTCDGEGPSDLWSLFGPMTPANVRVDGTPVKVQDGEQAPFVQNGRTFVPIRYVSEALGAKVNWHPELGHAGAAVVTLGDRSITAYVNTENLIINGWNFFVDAPVRIINGRVYVPIRYVVEGLGASVAWDAATQTATVRREPTQFDLKTLKDLMLGVLHQLASQFYGCGGVLCLSRSKVVLHTTPALWEEVYAHINAANEILKAALNQGKRVFVNSDKIFIAGLAAKDLTAATEAGETVGELAEGLAAAGLAGVVLSPAVIVPAAVVAVLAISKPAGMSDEEEARRIKEDQALMDEAARWQVNGNLNADSYHVCVLKAGTLIFGGLPGQSPYYTNEKTVNQAKVGDQIDAAILFKLLQVPPDPNHPGFRSHLGTYRVLKDITVACGDVKANPTWIKPGFGPILAGAGGGFQYFIPDFANLLKQVEITPMINWVVTNWDLYRPKP